MVGSDAECIVPFIKTVRHLYTDLDVSTILVTGSCGDYCAVADVVLHMLSFEALDVSAKAHDLCKAIPWSHGDVKSFGAISCRSIACKNLKLNTREPKILSLQTILYGGDEIKLDCVQSFVKLGQTHSVALCLQLLGDLTASSESPCSALIRKLFPNNSTIVQLCTTLKTLEHYALHPIPDTKRAASWLDDISRRKHPLSYLCGIRYVMHSDTRLYRPYHYTKTSVTHYFCSFLRLF